MRHLNLAFICLCLFCFPVLGQESRDPLLFAYIVESEENYNSVVMDARTAEIVHEIPMACFETISPDQQWLLYHDYDIGIRPQLFGLNLETEASILISDSASFSYWRSNGQLVYSSDGEDSSTNYLNLYDLASETNQVLATNSLSSRFAGDSLFFVTEDVDSINLHRWRNDEEEIIESFEHPEEDERMVLIRASISPNHQFIVLSYKNNESIPTIHNSYLINTATAEVSTFEEFANLLAYWKPQTPATFAYTYGDIVFIYDAITEQQEELFGFYGRELRWSPQGDYLISYNYDTDTRGFELNLMNFETEEIISFGEDDLSAQWLSQHEFIFFQASPENSENADIFLYNMQTNERRQLSNTPEIDEAFGCPIG